MSVIRSEKPEKPETPAIESERDLATVSGVEADIREFVRNDVSYLRRSGGAASASSSAPTLPSLSAAGNPPDATAAAPADGAADSNVTHVNSLIQRVAGATIGEIGKLVGELEALRDLLHSEGQRVQREVAGYAQLSQAAMKSTRIITENMAQWKHSTELTRGK